MNGLERRFLSGAVAVSMFASGCAAPKPAPRTLESTPRPTATEQARQTYNGPIEPLKGDFLMSDQRFGELTTALRNSGYPLLAKAGRDVTFLHDSDVVPAELDGLMSQASAPLSIVEDPESPASFAYSAYHSNQSETFKAISAGGETTWTIIYPPDLAIKIATPKIKRDAPSIVEGLFLAKEQFTLMLSLKLGVEFDQMGIAIIADEKGNPITDPAFLRKAGLSLVVKQGNDRESDLHKIVDVLPIMFIALDIRSMVNKGTLVDPPNTGAFHDASNFLLKEPATEKRVRELMTILAQSDNLTGPEGFTKMIFDPNSDLITKIYELNDILYPNGKPPIN